MLVEQTTTNAGLQDLYSYLESISGYPESFTLNHLITYRIMPVYNLAGELIRHSSNHIDIGTYTGPGIVPLSTFADHIVSFDIDPAMIERAKQDPQIAALIEQRRLDLMVMDARHISFAQKSFTSATCIEVLGAELKRDGDISYQGLPYEILLRDVEKIFSGIYDVLNDDGELVFTMKSRTAQESFAGLFWEGLPKGVPLYRSDILDMTKNQFQIEWYGQGYVKDSETELVIPKRKIAVNGRKYDVFDPEKYKPRPLHELRQEGWEPIFLIGHAKKIAPVQHFVM